MQKRILIVDDDAHIRLLLRRTLEELELEGVLIDAAEDGVEGLEKARALKPDLIFLDVMMPRMNGMDVCKHIRKDPELVGCHVIILTARGQTMPPLDLAHGPHEFLTKPFDPDHIISRAAEVLAIDLDLGF